MKKSDSIGGAAAKPYPLAERALSRIVTAKKVVVDPFASFHYPRLSTNSPKPTPLWRLMQTLKWLLCLQLMIVFGASSTVSAGVAYPLPPGGWTYLFDGNADTAGEAGSGFTSLDGTWSHDNGSDEWDGTAPGGTLGPMNRPGGAGTFTEGGINFLRIQDTGDPRDYGYADPGSNRKVYLGHDMSAKGATEAQLNEGVTLSFRARIPTHAKSSSPLDGLHRDGQQAGGVLPYPAGGDGYVTSDGGKGNFVLKQSTGGAIAFSLTLPSDNPGGDPNASKANFSGLTMNEFAGNAISGNVNFGQGSGTNVIALDPTEWHEFWIVLRKDPAAVGTHQAFIYMDGSLTPTVFKVTAGTGSDYSGITYLAMGSTATPQNSALDVDFVAYKLGVNFPPGYAEPPGGWTYIYQGDKAEAGAAGSGFSSLDGTWSHDNGSDEWDGSAPGGTLGNTNRPGGAGVFEERGAKFLRIQDTGDPRDFGYADPGSNRKIYLGHDMTAQGATETQMNEGVTLSFRARVPTPANSTSPLDGLHRDGQQAGGVLPYPAGGDGYVTSDGGKGNFVIKQSSGGAIAFSLTLPSDNPGGDPNAGKANFSGLTMNEFAGNAISASVNFGQGSGTNVIAFDPTEWHTFWIVLRKDPGNVGTHQAFIYLDGSFEPTVFKVTAGSGSDYSGITYLAIGSTATPQNSALDIDYVAYKLGTHFPGNALDSLPPDISDLSPPVRSTYQGAAQGLRFNVTTQGANSLNAAGFSLLLNGQDVSNGLTVTGPPQSRTAVYSALQPNTVYSGEIIVRDQAGRGATNRVSFDTFSTTEVTAVEAEDYNFGGGKFVDKPAVGAYQEQVGVPGVDFQDTLAQPVAANSVFRTADPVGTPNSPDYLRKHLETAGATEVQVGDIQSGEWLNYTRNITAGNYLLYARGGSAGPRGIRVDLVTGDRSKPGQAVAFLGVINVPNTGGAGSFDYGYLANSRGQPAVLALGGLTTLRFTFPSAAANLSLNYFALVPAPPSAETQVIAFPADGTTGVAPDVALEALVIAGSNPIDAASVKLFFDGADVSAQAQISTERGLVRLKFAPGSGLLASGSSHSARVVYPGGDSSSTFTVANLNVIPAAWGTDAASVSGKPRGFSGRIHKASDDAPGALFPNTIQRAVDQLAGKIIDPATGRPFANEAAGASGNGAFVESDTINYEQTGLDEGIGGDRPFPNLDALDQNNIAMEVVSYLELKSGVHRLGISCDDGFVVYAGPSAAEAKLVVGVREPGGGTAPVTFDFVIQKDGVYAFRMLFFEGTGGADIEWYSDNRVTGERILLNAPGSYRSFAARTGDGTDRPSPVSLNARVDGATILLTWPKTSPTFQLQTTAAVSPANWSAVGGSPVEAGETLQLRVPVSEASRFYRLAIP